MNVIDETNENNWISIIVVCVVAIVALTLGVFAIKKKN